MYKYAIAKIEDDVIDSLLLKRLCSTPYNAMKMFLKIEKLVKKEELETYSNKEIQGIFNRFSGIYNIKIVEIKIYN